MIKQISATSLKLYDTCPYCWKLKYVYKLIEPEKDFFIIGSGFHKGCELYHTGISPENIIDRLKGEWLDLKSEESIKTFGMIRGLVEFYFNNPLVLETLETEKQFSIKIEGVPVPIFGFIDRVVTDGITEYKTTSTDYKQEDIDNIQTETYSYAYYKLFGKMPLVTYYVVNKNKIKKPNYSPQILPIQKEESMIPIFEDKVRTFYNNIVNQKFDPNPAFHFSSIPGYCPMGK